MNWKDTTSYSAGERGKAEPRCWELQDAPDRLYIHRWLHEEGWCLTCSAMGFDLHKLQADTAEAAQAEALELARAWLRGIVHQWAAVLEE